VEVYKRECFGLVIGYRDRKGPEQRYIIEHAVPYQSAGRRHRTSRTTARASAHRALPPEHPANVRDRDFHSHTMWGYSRAASSPSETDLEGMKSENVYVILSVNDRLREVPWSYNDDGSLSGTTDDHHFRLTAYTVTPRASRDGSPYSARTRWGSAPGP